VSRARPLAWVGLALLAPALAHAGSISGRVVFRGQPPALAPIELDKHREACGPVVPDDALVVSPRGGVKHAVVSVDMEPRVTAGPGDQRASPRPIARPEVTLENRGCRFVPRVLAAQVGAEIVVVNGDPVLHNLRAWLEQRHVFNIVQPTQGQVTRRPIKRAGVIRLTCDTHPHMAGYLLAFDHPHFAVSDEDGRFLLRDVPAGTGRLTLWHQGWTVVERKAEGRLVYEPPRLQSRDVAVPDRGDVHVEFEMSVDR
jgi:hypothetical protein